MKAKKSVSRRSFLKKIAYAPPVVIGLGTLNLPSNAQASNISGNIMYDNGTTTDASNESQDNLIDTLWGKQI